MIDCRPPTPLLEWYETDDGGIYLPRQSFIQKELYIQQLNDCITGLTM